MHESRIALTILPLAIVLAAIGLAGGSKPTTATASTVAADGDDQHATADAVAEEQEDHEPVSWVRDLPKTTEYVRLLGAPDSLALHSGLVTLRPGDDCGWHSTENYEEMIICLEGAGHLESEGIGRRPLRAGQYGYNGPRTRHCVFNTGEKTMRYIYIVARVDDDEDHHEDDDHHDDDHHDHEEESS
ncbi:MAG: cupin domain-containing protein [Planctomycetota bacterium]|nr:cupin domain-containing protein [Planctomycetota bacterium]